MTSKRKTDKVTKEILARLGELSPEGLMEVIEVAQDFLEMLRQGESEADDNKKPEAKEPQKAPGYIEWKTIPKTLAGGERVEYGPYAYFRRVADGRLESRYIGKKLHPAYQKYVKPGRGRPKKS